MFIFLAALLPIVVALNEHLEPSYHFYPDTLESQDISAPIKVGDTWHVFVDCHFEDQELNLALSWCHAAARVGDGASARVEGQHFGTRTREERRGSAAYSETSMQEERRGSAAYAGLVH